MPVTITLETFGVDSTAGTSATTASITVASGELFEIDIYGELASAGSPAPPTSVSGAGLTFARVAQVNGDASYLNLSRWRAEATAGNSGAITINFAASQGSIHWAIKKITGHSGGSNGANAYVQTVTGTPAATTNPSVTLATFGAAGNATSACFSIESWSGTVITATADSPQVELSDAGYSAGSYAESMATTWYSGNDTSPAVTLSASPGTTVGIASEIAEGASFTLDQEGVTYGSDDGNEASHTLGTQDAQLTGSSVGDTIVARFLVDATGDPTSGDYSLRYSKNAGAFGLVPVGATQAETLAQPTWGAAGTAGSGTTSCAPAYPTGITAATSKLFCVVTGRSNTASTVPTMPAGWTRIGGLEGGTGTWGVDAGPRRVDVFQKDATVGDETGTVTVSLAGNTANTLRATIFRVEVASSAEVDVELVTGSDTSNDTSYSAAGSANLTLDANRLLILATAQNIDTGTATGRAISATGITFGAIANRADTAVTNGNDHRHVINSVGVSSGSGTVAPTFSYTISANGSGPTAFLSLRSRIPGATNEVFIKPSTNVPASGTATTARMAAPAGKTTGDFVAGRLLDDANSYTLDIGSGQYTELGFVVGTQSPLANNDSLKFRIYKDGSTLDTYTVEPQWYFGSPPVTGALAATDTPDTVAIAGPGAIPARLYYVIYPTALGEPSATQIKAGQDINGDPAVASGDEVAPTTDTDSFDFAQASGLSASTAYKASYVWSYGDAASDSNVVTTAEFTTAAGTGAATGVIAATESAGDTGALVGNLVAGASSAAAEPAGDTAALSGGLTASAALAATEPTGDAAALPAALLVSVSIAATETGGDTAAIVGGRVNIGAVVASEPAGDTSAVAGSAVAGASITAQESGVDAASLAGNAIATAALAATEAAVDAASIAGATVASVSVSATEAGIDTALVIATEADVALGVIAATETGQDSAAASAQLVAGASVAATEPATDSAAVSGAIVVSGVVAVTEVGDIALVDGKAIALAALVATETGGDTATLVAARESFAVIAAPEAAGDTAAIAGSVTTAPFTQAQLDYLLAYMEANLALWDEQIEAGMTARQLLRIIAAALAGTSQKAGNTITFKGVDGATDRIVGSYDAEGNRTGAVLDGG